MAEQTAKKNFKNTLNLPKTSFSMKANLVQNEPATLKRWLKQDMYQQMLKAREGSDRYSFHDGPPYANGSIHLGHLLNKVLKDFVVRSKTMAGFDVPYIPGWDCHGLPIEHKVMQELGDKAKGMVPMQIRKRCRDYAEKFIKLQKQQMQRLLTAADYDNPYLTMNPPFEAAVLEVFASMVGRGLVYRALKPVHWSIENQTALADAELEYYDREDTSVYVLFELCDGGATAIDKQYLMIWTTTPWTLPANMAVAVSAKAEYGMYTVEDKGVWMACDLAKDVLAREGVEAGDPQTVMRGEELVGWQYLHPFKDKNPRPVVAADYVTLEDGTGMVHTAPGHGVEDYQTGLREGLDIYCPVKPDGTFDDTTPDWLQGESIWEGNAKVCDHLVESGHMFHQHQFTHSYPHDWRGKTPVIFRATDQWFVDVNKAFAVEGEAEDARKSVRQRALDVTADQVGFIPAWGRNRMRGMLETRPDWCLSRQRAWGLPIPAFYCPAETPDAEKVEPLLTPASVQAVADVFRKQGSDAWFTMEVGELLAEYDVAKDAAAPDWAKQQANQGWQGVRKSTDIFDVWFESGSSWNACMKQRGLAKEDDAAAVTDLYLEGSDQHRGWFQLSLLPALAVTGKPPFANVLTHGFMVDKDGKKMSKSLGNTLEVEELLKEYGADVCRWWVASLNTDNDIKVDESFFKVAGEEYRKIRNTLRFMLSNLYDFDPAQHRHAFTDADATSLDAWALGELQTLVTTSREAYEGFIFRRVHQALFKFCNDTMSATYLAAVKDRLYCDKADSPRRRRTQTALFNIADAVIRLLAPLLPHTAEEAWQALKGKDAECVHLLQFPQSNNYFYCADGWPQILDGRNRWLKALEDYRQAADIDNPLDCGLSVPANNVLREFDTQDLADLCGVSRFIFADAAEAITVNDLRDEPRCERSWKRDGTVKAYDVPELGECLLSVRDAEAVGVAG